MTQQTYLCYARSGKEFDVSDEIRALGGDVWCGRRIEWVRTGKNRRPEPREVPALPNYLFATLTPDQYHAARNVKFLAHTMAQLSPGAIDGFRRFARVVDARHSADSKVAANATAPTAQFDPGEALQIIGGPFSEMTGTFRRIVEHAHDRHPRVEVMVNGIPVAVDPLSVRRAL